MEKTIGYITLRNAFQKTGKISLRASNDERFVSQKWCLIKKVPVRNSKGKIAIAYNVYLLTLAHYSLFYGNQIRSRAIGDAEEVPVVSWPRITIQIYREKYQPWENNIICYRGWYVTWPNPLDANVKLFFSPLVHRGTRGL